MKKKQIELLKIIDQKKNGQIKELLILRICKSNIEMN